jgi:hypothetical protein
MIFVARHQVAIVETNAREPFPGSAEHHQGGWLWLLAHCWCAA